MLTEVQIDEPIEKIIDGWDFLDEKIVAKFSSFRDEERAARAIW